MVRTLRLTSVVAMLLGGCSLAPHMTTPSLPAPDNFKEADGWVQAQPADRLPRDSWWSLYQTPQIDDLEKQLIEGNPSIANALANYNQARALEDQARAGFFPTIGANAGVTRTKESRNAPLITSLTPHYYDNNTVGGTFSYELDLWGQIRNQVAEGRANAQAAGADLENARLSLLAQMVDDYVQLRSLDRELAILDDTVKAYDHALTITQQRHGAGIAPGLDVSQAETQLRSARSQLKQVGAQRAVMEHAIAALLGVPASGFSIAPEIVDIKLPPIPAGMPATLLERRPDVAAAQRRMIAANANIGVARAAYFPSLTIGGQGGYQSTSFSKWLTAPSTFWAIGPNAVVSILDGGLRRAQVAQARAQFDATAANYREVAVTAFQEVEDALAKLHYYSDAAQEENAAVDAAQRTLDFSTTLYKQGATDYLNVVTSQTALLQARLQSLNLDTMQLSASVDLIKSLGGGWEDPQKVASR
jgi:NodT family efflux transporter outer membrane factor (OMF) lipoprotein